MPPVKPSSPTSAFSGFFDPPAPLSKTPAPKFDWTPPESPTPPPPETPKGSTGEFTSFFSGPFDQPGTSKKLDTIPDLAGAGPAKQSAGDFTKIFGSEVRESPQFSGPEPLPEKTPGSFTQIFGNDSDRSAQLGVSTRLDTDPGHATRKPFSEPTPLAPESPATGRGASIFGTPTFAAPAPAAPKTPVPSSRSESTSLFRSGPADATDVFRVPGGADAPAMSEAPSGPSEFTVFLSRSQLNASLPPEPAMAPPPAPGAAPPPFAAPAAPPFAFPPPPMQPPKLAVPPPPALARPAAPPMPGLASYWPLITVFTILLAVGALLIMYFAFKH
jgi:hypothetical protein